MNDGFLYAKIKASICSDIFYGRLSENERLPPERIMAEQMGVSRVTLRKALEDLENDGIIKSIQGSGNYLCFNNIGNMGNLDFVALIASARHPFFNRFLEEFQKTADKNETMVLFLQKPHGMTFEESIFRLFEKNVRDVVVWPEDAGLDENMLRRLRGLGMNMVSFDTGLGKEYADCVYLDNEHAMSSLYNFIKDEFGRRVLYIGWDNIEIFSINQRQCAIRAVCGNDFDMLKLSWEQRRDVEHQVHNILEENVALLDEVDAIMYENAEIGTAVVQTLKHMSRQKPVAGVDNVPEAEMHFVTTYEQPIAEMAKCAYNCLLHQNKLGAHWKPKCFPLKGNLIIRNRCSKG